MFFVISMEGFSALVENAIDDGLFYGYFIFGLDHLVSLFQFTDNTLIFLKLALFDIHSICCVIHIFYVIYELKVYLCFLE